MPVLVLESALSLARGGEPGDLDQTGARSGAKKTLVGLRPSVSNFSSVLLDRPADLILHGDNPGVLNGWHIGRDHNHAVNAIFKSIHTFLESAQHTRSFTPCYIASSDNPADPPSRGIYGPIHLLLPPLVIPEHAWDFLTDTTDPLSACELRELWEGKYSASVSRTLNHLHAWQQEAKCA
jgi:hypothetical protein